MNDSILDYKIPDNVSATNKWTVVFSDGNLATKAQEVFLPSTIKSPYDLDLTQFITNLPIDLPGMIKLAAELIDDSQARAEIVPSERVKLVEEYQPDHFPEIGDECITFKVVKREPANMSRDGKSRPNRSFGHAYEYQSALEPNKIICIESRPIDHIIEFAAWAKTATLANSRALWLERLFVSHRWVFTSKGVNPFFWKGRGPDTPWTSGGTRLHQRPMQFSARMKEHSVVAFPTIKEFEMDINTQTLGGF